LIGFVLLLTPTGKLPSPGWRWWARAMVAAPILLLGVVTLAGGPLDPRYQALGGPFDLRGLGGILLAANQLALAVTTLAVVAAAGSLVGRFRRARGVERLQLRWVAWAAVLVVLGGVAVLVALAVGVRGATAPLGWAVGVSLAVLPVAIGAAILRYRLYDLDRIISRTLAYGLLTIVLGLAYAGVVPGPWSAAAPELQPGGGHGHPGRGRGGSAGPSPYPAGGRPPFQPPPPRRRPAHRGLRGQAARPGRPGPPDG
jgi:hypothetical protein